MIRLQIRRISLLTSLFVSFFLIAFAQSTLFVQRVVDGDTIVLSDSQKVRLIGVDTPESVHPNKPVERFAKEAAEFTKRIAKGKKVRLEYDWQKTDKYGRILAYVFVLEGGTEIFLNAEIIKQGYGFAYLKYPFRDDYMKMFKELEVQAREEGRGLWAEEKEEVSDNGAAQKQQNQEVITVYITRTGAKYHRDGCRYLSKSKIPITLKEAINRGYTPCSVCGIPTLR